jgi:hypothetical protein
MSSTRQIERGGVIEIVRYVFAAGDTPSSERFISGRVGRRGTVLRWRGPGFKYSSVPSHWLDVKLDNGGVMALQINEVVAVDD